jgi:hypothetical protein
MVSSIRFSNYVGAVVAVTINVFLIALFIARLSKKPRIEHWLGIVIILNAVPLLYLFVKAFSFKRPVLYFIQIGLMIAYLIVELILDYILKVDFRQNLRIVIPYIMLFFSGTGGMIGVASHAGKGWLLASIISFLVMMALSFIQRAITGQ